MEKKMSFFWFVPTPFKELLGRGGGEEGRRELSFFSFELRWAARGCACAMCFKRTGRWPTSSSSPRRQPPLPASPPAASASRFPASSLRFPAGSLRFPASSDGDSRTLSNFPPKKENGKGRTNTRSTREPSTPAGRRSASTMWLSVPPETSVWPRFWRPVEFFHPVFLFFWVSRQ
jgi:hypothetical protein